MVFAKWWPFCPGLGVLIMAINGRQYLEKYLLDEYVYVPMKFSLWFVSWEVETVH